MRSKTSQDRPPASVRAAEIVGPFAGADRIHGTHDGHNVWAATGARLVAFGGETDVGDEDHGLAAS